MRTKLVCCIGLLVAVHFTARAQRFGSLDQPFNYGIKVGVTRSYISNLETTILSEPYFLHYTLQGQPRIGWTGGAFLNYRFIPNVALAAEIMYAQQGSNLLFSNLSYVPGDAVQILHWTGLPGLDNGSAGNDRLLFSMNPGFSNETMAYIQFFDDAGALFATGATLIPFNGYTELVPVPEPSSWMLGVGSLLLLGSRRRARRA